MKMGESLRRKARFVADRRKTNGVQFGLSRDSFRIATTIAALNNRNVLARNIQNAYTCVRILSSVFGLELEMSSDPRQGKLWPFQVRPKVSVSYYKLIKNGFDRGDTTKAKVIAWSIRKEAQGKLKPVQVEGDGS
jgi:hypothetical protein